MGELGLEALTKQVFEILRDDILVPGEGFSPESDLIESGLDSLSVTQLLLSIEEHTGLWVDERLLTPENVESAQTLAAMLHAQLSQA